MKEHITYTDLLKQNTLLEVPDERAHMLDSVEGHHAGKQLAGFKGYQG